MIHCQKCKTINPPEAQKCSQCGANLLPGYNVGSRLAVLAIAIVLGTLCPYLAFRFTASDLGGSGGLNILMTCGFNIIMTLAGIGVIIFGIYWMFRKTPIQERYQTRAERHIDLDPQQAIADYSAVLDLASTSGKQDLGVDLTDVLLKRGGLYKKQGLEAEAKGDLERALIEINRKIALSNKWETDLQMKRLQVSTQLGMPDPALDVMKAAISAAQKPGTDEESENSRTNSRIALSILMNDGEHGIIGYCERCAAEVAVNSNFLCKTDSKHKKITNLRPIRIIKTGEEINKAG